MWRWIRSGWLVTLAATVPSFAAGTEGPILRWESLPVREARDFPSGAFVSVAGNCLIVAGGSETSSGTLSDVVNLLCEPAGKWVESGVRLPQPAAHGASLHWNGSAIFLGGKDSTGPLADTVLIKVHHGKPRRVDLSPMPAAAASLAGAVLGDTVYVAGGRGSSTSLRTFWALDLALPHDKRVWRELPPWPGPPRSHAIAAAQDESFFLFGGSEFREDGVRDLNDAYRYTPGKGWKRLADLPFALEGAATPAVALGQSHVLILSRQETPGASDAPTKKLLYHTITDTWRTPEDLPKEMGTRSFVSLPTVWWRGGALFPTPNGPMWVKPQVSGYRLATLDYVVWIGYVVALIAIGLYFARRKQRTEDYFLAGRRVPWWAAGLSMLGTSISAITFMAIPALVYRTDWVYYLGNATIIAVAPVIVAFFLPFYRRLKVVSVYEYLERRFGLAARLVGSTAFLLFQMGRMGIVVYLPALALAAVTGFDVYACIILASLLAVLYTVFGGIEAVIWTDVLQVFVLLGGVAIALVICVGAVPGGLAEIIGMSAAEGKLRAVDLTWDVASAGLWVVVVGNFFKFLIPCTSDQATIQRYLVTRDERQASRAIWLNALLSVLVWSLFFALGTSLWAFYRVHPELLNPLARNDEIFPWFIVQQMPAGISGLLIAGVFAAAMSSLDSSMNSIAAVVTFDFYGRFKPVVRDTERLRIARIVTVFAGAAAMSCALYMAYIKSASMWDQFMKLMGLFGGGLAGMFVAGIFTRRTSSRGILVGFAASTVVLYYLSTSRAVHFFLYGAAGIFSCLIVGWLASWFLPDRERNLSGLTVHSSESRRTV